MFASNEKSFKRAAKAATATAAIAAVASLSTSNAQGLPTGLISGLSQGCLGSLAGLLGNQGLNECMALTPAITTFGGLGANDSVAPAVSSFLTSDFCPAQVCNSTTLSTANGTLNQGCSQELTSGTNPLPYALSLLINDYAVIKNASCEQDTSANNQNCVAQSLTNAQGALGGRNISFSLISSLLGNSSQTELMQAEQALLSNKTFLCTSCNKELFQTLAPSLNLNQSTQQTLEQNISTTCGADFLTSAPTNLKSTGDIPSSSDSSSGSSGSSSSSSSGSSTSSTGSNGAGYLLPGTATAAAALLAAGLALIA